tara:strand:+ start:1577 stop:1972 length:396 start_codon:yes stop_codon:yes gene_type:complete
MENKLIDHILRDTSWTAPATVYVGLIGAYVPADLEAGTITAEITGNAYARISVKGDANWSAGSTSGLTDNENAIEFVTAAGGDWGYVSGLFLSNASTAGNVILYGALTTPKIVENGDQFVIAAGDLDITFA